MKIKNFDGFNISKETASFCYWAMIAILSVKPNFTQAMTNDVLLWPEGHPKFSKILRSGYLVAALLKCYHSCNKIYYAPSKNIGKSLDIGCGILSFLLSFYVDASSHYYSEQFTGKVAKFGIFLAMQGVFFSIGAVRSFISFGLNNLIDRLKMLEDIQSQVDQKTGQNQQIIDNNKINDADDIDVPADFIDPVFRIIMDNPYIVTANGDTLDLSSYNELAKRNNYFHPITRLPMFKVDQIIPNRFLKNAIDDYVANIESNKPELKIGKSA